MVLEAQTHTMGVALHMVAGVHRLGTQVLAHHMTLAQVQVPAALMHSLPVLVLQRGVPATPEAAHQLGMPHHRLPQTATGATTLLPLVLNTLRLPLVLMVVHRLLQERHLRQHHVLGLTVPLPPER